MTSLSRTPAVRRTLWFGARRRPQAITGLLMVTPFVVAFMLFQLLPILWSLAMAFTDTRSRDLRDPFSVNFVGTDNFVRLFSDDRFLRALTNTAVFVVVSIPLTIAIALLLAVVVNNGINRLKGFFRTAFFVPVVTSTVAAAVVWKFLFADRGVVNWAVGLVGIDGPNWLQDPSWAMSVVVLLAVWRNVGIIMVLFLAGLQGIPPELYEASKVDGAGAVRRLVSITLPLLMPTMLFAGILLSVSYVQVFEEPFVLTQGGPLQATTTASLFVYDLFGFGRYGEASAASYVLFIAIALLALIQFRVFRRRT